MMIKITLLEPIFMEVKYDNEPSRFLGFVKVQTSTKGIVFLPILDNGKDLSVPLRDRTLLFHEEVYPVVLEFSKFLLGGAEIEISRFNPEVSLKEPGLKAVFKPNTKNPYEIAAYIMRGLFEAEPLDEYLYFRSNNLTIIYNDREKLGKKFYIPSSDYLDKFFNEALEQTIIYDMILLGEDVFSYSPEDKGRFLVHQEEYYVLRLGIGYLMSEYLERGFRLTKHHSRAMKFLSEDEALAYALGETGTSGAEFNVERIEEPCYLPRTLPADSRNILTMEGRSIEESSPFLSLETAKRTGA